MKILVVTNAPTFRNNEKFSAYAPYVKEMDIWFKNVEEVGILSPGSYPDSVFTQEFNYQGIKRFRLPFIKFANFLESLLSILLSPLIFFQFLRSFIWADHIHLRCPGNIGMIGCFAQILFPGKPKTAKYAGNWDPDAKQPWSYKIQRWILSNTFLTRNMKVLVYGDWPRQSKNIFPFFTASFAKSEIEKTPKEFNPPYKFLFVGNFSPGKKPLFAIQLVEGLINNNIPAELHLYGEGQCKEEIKQQAKNKGYIHIHGNQTLEVLKQTYKESHFLILASKSEGWPKVIAEAMFFGCIPIATGVSCVPWMLGSGSRGILITGIENKTERREKRNKVKSGLLDTFQKDRQFKFFPKSAEAVSENVSRTGFSETPAFRQGRPEVTSGKLNEDQDVLDETVLKIIKLIKDPVEMRRMSVEALEWSQQYTLERFEAAIKELLFPNGARP